jgi:L-ascorbate metabolism protein UlaG (beta-lactamase superfamily)
MVISYYGVSCFKVQSGEVVLIFDPPSKESGFKPLRFQANAVLISHNHKNHNGRENPSRIVIDGPGEYEISETYIYGIESFHDSVLGKKHGLNTIYVARIEDITICHLGDFGESNLRQETIEAIGKIDILFVPIGGKTVLDSARAVKISSQLEPKIIIPMHYNLSDNKKDLKGFLDEFGSEIIKPVDKLTVKKKDFSDKKTQAVVLSMKNEAMPNSRQDAKL